LFETAAVQIAHRIPILILIHDGLEREKDSVGATESFAAADSSGGWARSAPSILWSKTMQRLTIVRYKVKPECVDENERLSHAVFDRVRRDRPRGIDYSLFKEADGQSFVHVFRNQIEDDSDVLTELPEFKAFSATISARCDIPPEVTRLSVDPVDTYGSATAEV